MENANTYRAILLGMILVFGGCLFWLLISRNEIARASAALDQSRLKYESLLSEKLLVEKSLKKTKKLLDTAVNNNVALENSLTESDKTISLERSKNGRLSKLVQTTRLMNSEAKKGMKQVTADLLSLKHKTTEADAMLKLQADSLEILTSQMTKLQSRLDAARTRSIDQTLVVAGKRNNKITSNARQTRELVAQVELPIELQDLVFTVETPEGAILSNESTLTARQLAIGDSFTASLNNANAFLVKTRKMEISYKPKEKLRKGLYVFKIFNDRDYVGSMNIQLQ